MLLIKNVVNALLLQKADQLIMKKPFYLQEVTTTNPKIPKRNKCRCCPDAIVSVETGGAIWQKNHKRTVEQVYKSNVTVRQYACKLHQPPGSNFKV